MPYVTDCNCIKPKNSRCLNITSHCLPIQCKNCGVQKWDNEARQRRIWKASRVASSLYTMNLSSLNALSTHESILKLQPNKPLPINWTPKSAGEAEKHGSYSRYLAVKKGKNSRTTPPSLNPPIQGNKINSFGLYKNSITCTC